MKIGLAQYEFRNNDIQFNLSQIKKAMMASLGEVDLLCFGESFLQGFDALSWDYEKDRDIAVTMDSFEILQICNWSREYGIAVVVGYFEREEEAIYSSCAFINHGQIEHNYRRVSRGWKEVTKTDCHYQEGNAIEAFSFMGHTFEIALCGDLWDTDWEKFQTDATVLWPVYVNYSLEEWQTEEKEYADQASRIAGQVLMVNSLSKDPVSHGGTFCFRDGEILSRLSYDEESILVVEL